MHRIAFIFLACVAVSANGGFIMPRQVPALDGRIVGGTDADITQFPYQVSIHLGESHWCGGCIYNSTVILTAAHCVLPYAPVSWYSVQHSVAELDNATNVMKVKSLVRHPDYNSKTISNDVAMIFLESSITYSPKAQPIALASVSPDTGAEAIVTGWGTLSEGGTLSSKLQQVKVGIVDRKKCEKEYADVKEITDSMLCAGIPEGGKDACQGDSGGPMVVDGQLAGIVSWGAGCARPGFPGVYCNVAFVKSWIEAGAN